jgi:hypothetical protein
VIATPAGIEHELLLTEQLRRAGVTAFWTERQLREQGQAKTPDVLLQACEPVRQAGTIALAGGRAP